MAQPLLLFVAMLSGAPGAEPVPAEINLTLGEIRSLSPEARAAHFNALMRDGYHAVDGFMTGWGVGITYRSPAHAAGPGICEATEASYFWWVTTDRPPYEVPPPDAEALPLRREDSGTKSVYRRVDGRRLRPGSARLERACDSIDRYAHFVSASSAEAFRRAERILAAVHRELERRPVAIEVSCQGWTDCRDRILQASLDDVESISECIEWDNQPPRPNCLRFNLPATHGPTMFATKGFEVDIEPGNRIRILRLRWRAMMHTS